MMKLDKSFLKVLSAIIDFTYFLSNCWSLLTLGFLNTYTYISVTSPHLNSLLLQGAFKFGLIDRNTFCFRPKLVAVMILHASYWNHCER